MFALFFGILSLIFVSVVYFRIIKKITTHKGLRLLASVIATILASLMTCALIIPYKHTPHESIFALTHVGYYAMTFAACVLVLIILFDILFGIYKIFSLIIQKKYDRAAEKALNEHQTEEAETLKTKAYACESRRAFLGRAAAWTVLGTSATCTPISAAVARNRIIRTTELAFNRLPSQFDGLRIVHLSDIHVGNTFTKNDIAEIVNETNALNPDIIVITGDIGDGIPEFVAPDLEPMRDFKSKFGVFYVTGNHEHLWGAQGWCKAVSDLGIHVLNNDRFLIEHDNATLAVCGAIDFRGDRRDPNLRSDPALALDGIPDKIFKLMLVHQPASVDTCFEHHADLVLLGHTHGGQFWPACYIVDAVHKYARGLYWNGEQAAYVSCGTGYWGPPLRLGVPPEICLHILHTKS